jgi:hypothetical protein
MKLKKNCWHHLNLNLLILLLLVASCHHSGDCIAIVPSAAKLVGLLSMEPSTGTSPAFESKVINVTSSQVFHQHHDNAADDDFARDEQSHPLLMSEWAYYTSGVYLVLITFTGLIMNLTIIVVILSDHRQVNKFSVLVINLSSLDYLLIFYRLKEF